jgi:alpha-1,2-mannosyltransferase
MSAILIIALLTALPLIPFLVKILVRRSLRLVGWSLQRRTSKRRELIASRVRSEEQAYQSAQKGLPKADDEDWEKIESYAAGSAPNGDLPTDVEWEGVVGFFHPFWSVTWQ